MSGSNPAADIEDSGVNSSFLIYKRDSTPAYEEFTSGQVFQHGGLARGGSKVQYGSSDVQNVELVRGGQALVALVAGAVEIAGDLDPEQDNIRDLSLDTTRWRHLHLSGRFTMGQFRTVADGDATPAVGATGLLKTANTTATTITALDNGNEGQPVMVVFGDSNTTVDFTGTNLKGNGGVDWSPTANDHMTCIYDGTNWFCDISDNTA